MTSKSITDTDLPAVPTFRFIVVQTSACALFGAFTSSIYDVPTKSIASLDRSVVEDMGGEVEFDATVRASDIRDALAVYRVPTDFPAYDETEVSGQDVSRGRLFEDFRSFVLAGAIVPVEEADDGVMSDGAEVERRHFSHIDA